jgi:UDP-glucose:(glucosyl)LPS alpha-1,2-glucosyltransferase
MKPLGGTELQYALLHKYVDKKLLNNFQITTSVPEKIPLAKDKINILWEQNSYDQPNIQPWMKDPSNHSKYDWYVFNSHWCAEKYRMFFKLPADKCTVIKNAIEHFPERKVYKKGDPIKLIFHPTPWRGLNVMLGAMQLIKNKNVTLDVYSSTEVYGTSFKKANDKIYQPLYKQAKKLPNVNYIGYKPNEQIVKNITQYQIFAYPNIWEETSCISAIEAMAAGLHMVTTNYGALYETCSEWPVYVQYSDNYKRLAEAFAYAIDSLTSFLHEDGCQNHLQSQANFYKKFYNWQARKEDWTNFLTGALNAKS